MSRPTLVRIPFSHFCRKAEWGLTQAGIAYDTLDIYLAGMRHIDRISTEGTVPILIVDGEFIEGSDRILTWASEHAAGGTTPLYPEAIRGAVQEWEVWGGEAVGPVARREAYRVAYNLPERFTTKRWIRAVARLGRPQVLNVLKFYKVRRFDEHDQKTIPQIFRNIADELERQGTGYLVGDAPTAADLSVAALCEPFTYAAPGRDYAGMDGWKEVEEFIARVKPKKTLRKRRRRMTGRRWDKTAALRGLETERKTVAA